jgi:hypothetical protein
MAGFHVRAGLGATNMTGSTVGPQAQALLRTHTCTRMLGHYLHCAVMPCSGVLKSCYACVGPLGPLGPLWHPLDMSCTDVVAQGPAEAW